MEFSMFPWETQSGTGDGANSYTQDQANNFFRYFDVQDPTVEGIAKGVLNELVATFNNDAINPSIDIDTGVAVCYGRYWNDAVVTLDTAGSLFLPGVGTTGGALILEADWATNTIRLNVIMNTDGVIAIPALTQTAGVLWQTYLYTFTLTTLGVFTATDVRAFRIFTGEVRDVDGDVSIIPESISHVSILNRTRTVFVPAFTGIEVATVTTIQRDKLATNIVFSYGVIAATGILSYYGGSWQLPTDYATADPLAYVNITPVFFTYGAGAGNVYISHSGHVGAAGAAYNTRALAAPAAAIPIVAVGNILAPPGMTLVDTSPLPTIGDYYNFRFIRDATNVLDTYGGQIVLMGWTVQYLADM